MKKARHTALPCPAPGKLRNVGIFPEREKALSGPSWDAARPGPCREGTGKLNIWPGIWDPQKGRAHRPAPPHRLLCSPEPGSLGGTVLPMLGRRYSMLGTDCGSLSSTGVCRQEGAVSRSLPPMSPQAAREVAA